MGFNWQGYFTQAFLDGLLGLLSFLVAIAQYPHRHPLRLLSGE